MHFGEGRRSSGFGEPHILAGLVLTAVCVAGALLGLAFTGGDGLFSGPILVICALTLFLVWVERSAFAAFLGQTSNPNSLSS